MDGILVRIFIEILFREFTHFFLYLFEVGLMKFIYLVRLLLIKFCLGCEFNLSDCFSLQHFILQIYNQVRKLNNWQKKIILYNTHVWNLPCSAHYIIMNSWKFSAKKLVVSLSLWLLRLCTLYAMVKDPHSWQEFKLKKRTLCFAAQSAKYALHCAQYAKCLDWTADEIIGKHNKYTVRRCFYLENKIPIQSQWPKPHFLPTRCSLQL